MTKALFAGLLSVSAIVAHAQSGGTPPQTPPVASPASTPSSSSAQPPQRGSIAPIVDIRIQGDGISLPKGVGEAPPPEKPPAK
jgi:hypothetical protein